MFVALALIGVSQLSDEKEKYEGCPRHLGKDEYLDIFA